MNTRNIFSIQFTQYVDLDQSYNTDTNEATSRTVDLDQSYNTDSNAATTHTVESVYCDIMGQVQEELHNISSAKYHSLHQRCASRLARREYM